MSDFADELTDFADELTFAVVSGFFSWVTRRRGFLSWTRGKTAHRIFISPHYFFSLLTPSFGPSPSSCPRLSDTSRVVRYITPPRTAAMLTPRVLKASLLRCLRATAELPPLRRPRYASSLLSSRFWRACCCCATVCARQVFALTPQLAASYGGDIMVAASVVLVIRLVGLAVWVVWIRDLRFVSVGASHGAEWGGFREGRVFFFVSWKSVESAWKLI